MREIVCQPLAEPFFAAAAALEEACLETAWSEKQLRELPDFAVYRVAVDGAQTVCGTGSLYCIGDEAELQNLAVDPAFRRQGIGEGLMRSLFAEAKKRGCAKVFLEVASRNLPARKLYEKVGFAVVGKRKGFYKNDDAVLMALDL